LGDKGALVYNRGEFQLVAPHKVRAIDTTGAGDAFIGAFAYYYAKSKNLNESVIFANAAAALSVTKIGTQTSFPALADIENVIKTY